VTPSQSIVVGVISGVIAAALVQLCLLVFDRILLPWYREIVYHGVIIQGKWEECLTFAPERLQVTTYDLVQKANDVSGSVTCVKTDGGVVARTEVMTLKGSLRDRFFECAIFPVDRSRVAAASVLLEVVGDGSRMFGYTSWYDSNAAVVTSEPVTWTRIP